MLLQDFTAWPVRPSVHPLFQPTTIQRGSLGNRGTDIYTMSTLGFTSPFKPPHSLGSIQDFFQHKNHKWPLLQPVDLCQSLSKAALHTATVFPAHLTSCNLSSNKCKHTTGNSSAFLGPNFTSLIAFGIEIREARACVALSQPCSLAIKEFMGSLSRKWDHFSSAAPRLQRILLVFWGESGRPEAYSIHHLGRGSHIPADLSASSVGELNK